MLEQMNYFYCSVFGVQGENKVPFLGDYMGKWNKQQSTSMCFFHILQRFWILSGAQTNYKEFLFGT